MGGKGIGDQNEDGGVVPSSIMSKKNSKAKGHHDKKRFQLFDPSSRSELIGLCDDDGIVQLILEEEDDCQSGVGERNDNSVSLDFDEGSSDEEEVENLPKDNDNQLMATAENAEEERVGLFCGSCSVKFSDLAEQRLHYTLDWHRYNLKRKLHGQGFVTETKFDEMIDDLSSIDGSDNEVDETAAGGTQQVERLLEKLSTSGPNQQSHQLQAHQVHLSRSQKLEKSPKVFFKNSKGQILSCYKTVLLHKPENQEVSDKISSNKLISLIKNPLRITIIMASGGHFAAAVFEGNSCTHHKTFHSYTVRAKQGGSQGGHDAKSGTKNAKSAGASLRRYNQQSFTQHVQDLLASWKTNIAESDLVFFKAVSANATILFTGKNPPLSKDSKKLRTIPFPTKRPTFNEIKRVHSLLMTVHLYDSIDSFLAAHSHLVKTDNSADRTLGSPSKQKSKRTIDRAKSRSPKRKDQLDVHDASDESVSDENQSQQLVEVDQIVDFNALKEYDDSLTPEQRKEGNKNRKKKKKDSEKSVKPEGILGELADALQQENLERSKILLNNLKEIGESAQLNLPIDVDSSTLLHVASKTNQIDNVWSLMEAGCDPAIRDKFGKYPYNYAESRECRDTFRKFMGENPDKYDYKKAQVPPPLSEELEKERAEKKKLLNKIKREKEKQKKMERKEKEKETEEQRRFLNLSDREKRALAAEQRILAQCKKNSEKPPVLVRCFDCAIDITGKVPFEYNQNVFCSTKCLAAHRKKFPAPLSV